MHENTYHGPARTAGIGVLRSRGEYLLVACEPLRAGGYLFPLSGAFTKQASRYSVQVGSGLHLDLPRSTGHEQMMDTYFWRFMNHSCEPNVRISERRVFALSDIQKGEEITFNYNTTEEALAEPFDCRCGSARCSGRIAGYSAVDVEEHDRLWPWIAPHLLPVPARLSSPDLHRGREWN